MSFRIDNVKMKIVASDIDGDGITGETESVSTHKDKGMISVKDSSELGEALEHINRDEENDLKLSSIDFNSRINEYQLSPLIAVDTIASMGVISSRAKLVVRNTMRKSVSIQGKGREESVEMVTGKKENDIKKGSMSNLAGAK